MKSKRKPDDVDAQREYLESCVETIGEALNAFRTSQPSLECVCRMNDKRSILLQFRMKGTTLRKRITIPAATRSVIPLFVKKALADTRLMVSTASRSKAVLTYYLRVKDEPRDSVKEIGKATKLF